MVPAPGLTLGEGKGFRAARMERTLITNSSTIAEVGYDAAAGVLEVLFLSGTVYQFFDVPEAVAVGLTSPWTGSVGQYFEQNIRGTYPYAKL